MKRGPIGRYERTSVGGETVQAFLPKPLPPSPELRWSPALHQGLARASLALGRLDSVSRLVPNPELFLYSYVRKEAVLSSQIEGTQSSLSDLFYYEADAAPPVPLDDVQEVSNYVAALDHGLKRLRGGFPLSLRLLKEVHAVLLRGGRGADKDPGEWRRSQNWIGGVRPGKARFVPPPPRTLMEHLGALESYLHAEGHPVLVKAALSHVQFETIHPFLDGNGRLGRLLVALLLCHEKALAQPLLYLSLYFKRHRQTYYELLQRVRLEGVWEEWLDFFLEAVEAVADEAFQGIHEWLALAEKDRARIRDLGKAAGSALKVHQVFLQHPVLSLAKAGQWADLSFNTVQAAFDRLSGIGLVREASGKRRNRVYVYSGLLDLLSRGTEEPAE